MNMNANFFSFKCTARHRLCDQVWEIPLNYVMYIDIIEVLWKMVVMTVILSCLTQHFVTYLKRALLTY